MASLTGNLVAETYKALLKTIDNDILTASEKQITDGLGGGSNVFIDSQGFLRANKYKVTNGLATQFLKADGSLDSNAYLTSITGAQVITALGFTPVTNQRTLTINGVTYNLTADRTWTIEGTAAVWGNITGTLSNQTDLQNALNAKYNVPTGTISQYIRGDGSIANFPAVTGFVPYTGATANVDLGEYALSAEYLAIDTDTTHVTDVGEIVWNPIDGTFDMGLLNGVVLQAGQELHFYGKASGAIGNGQAVMFAGVEGDHLLMSLADAATINANPQYFIGIATQDFANNEFGYVTVLGKVRGLNTTSYSLGDVLYYNSTSATDGSLTTTMPVAPNAKIEVAAVVRVHATQGILMVRPHIMPKLNQVQDVYIADPANNHGLFYDLANGYWRNTSIATALGYTPQAQLSGTGFVKASGTTISYDNSTYLTTADAESTYQRLDRMAINLLASDIQYPNNNAVIAALALKANAANPVFTGNMTISGAEPKLFFTDTDNNPDYTVFIDSGVFYIYDQTAGTTRFSISSTGNISAGVGKSITADSFIKDGGTASQFLKADGTIDSNTYVASSALANYLLISTAASTYQRLDNMAINLLASDTQYPNNNAVIAALALKANAANPVFTGNMSISGAEPKLFFVDTDNNPDYTVFIDSGFFYIYDQTAGATRFSINSSGNISTGVGKSITAGSFVKDGGTSSQFLMADGSVTTFAGVTGSGTTNYLPKWTSGSGLGNSIIQDDTTKIGITSGGMGWIYGNDVNHSIILRGDRNSVFQNYTNYYQYGGTLAGGFGHKFWTGGVLADQTLKMQIADDVVYIANNTLIGTTTNSGYKLDVNGSGRFGGDLRGSTATFTGNVSTGALYPSYLSFYNAGATNKFIKLADDASEIDAIGFSKSGSTATVWFPNGKVGIGTNVPDAHLHINSSTQQLKISGNTNSFGIYSWNGGINLFSNENLYFGRDAAVNNKFYFQNASASATTMFINTATERVMIGTTVDSGYKFDVNGTGRFTSSFTASGLLIANDRLYMPGNHPISNWFSSSLTIGYSSGNSYGWVNGATNLVLGTDGVERIRIGNTGLATFSDNIFMAKGTDPRIYSGSGIGLNIDGDALYLNRYSMSAIIMTPNGGNVLVGTTTNNGYKLNVNGSGYFSPASSSSVPTLMLHQSSGGAGAYANISGANDMYHGMILRGVPAAAGDYSVTAGDQMSFYEYGGVFNFYKKQPGVLTRQAYIDNGNFYGSAYFETSDFRLKTLIEHNPIIDGIEKLEAKLYEKNGKIEIGYFAQDAELIMPYAVTKNDDGFLNLSYREVHTAKIARLEKEVAELKEKLNLN